MKHFALLLTCVAISVAAIGADEPKPENSVYKLLKETKIQKISLQESPLEDALKYFAEILRKQSGREIQIRHLSLKEIPDKAKSLDFEPPGNRVTLALENVSALEALRYFTELAFCRFVVWGDEVIVFSTSVEAEPYRLAVWSLGPYEFKHLEELGTTVFEDGLNVSTSVPFEDFLARRDQLGLKTTNPFEAVGAKAAPGSFAALIGGKWRPSFLIAYNTELSLDLIGMYMDSFEYLWWFDDNYFANQAKEFETPKGWERVEKVLKVSELHPATSLTWPAELHQLVTLAKTLEKLSNDPNSLKIEPDAIPGRVEEIRKMMLRLADRYTASLRLYGEVRHLVPDSRPRKDDGKDDPFSSNDLGLGRVYQKPATKQTETKQKPDTDR